MFLKSAALTPLLFVAAWLLPAMAFAQGGQTINMVVASIDGEPLTVSDLKQFLKDSGQPVPADPLADKEQARKMVRALVNEKLIEKEAQSLGIAVDDAQVAAYIDEIKRQNNTDEAGLARALKERGIELDDYKKQVRGDILKTRIISAEVRAKVTVTDDDVVRYIKEHPELAPTSGEVHLFQIYIKAAEGEPSRADAEQTIGEIHEKITGEGLKTEDQWAEVGGPNFSDLGYVAAENLRSELQDAVSSLGEGEVSDVVATGSGYYVLFVAERAGDEVTVAPALKERIKRDLYQQELKRRFEEFSQNELPNKYQVEYRL